MLMVSSYDGNGGVRHHVTTNPDEVYAYIEDARAKGQTFRVFRHDPTAYFSDPWKEVQ